MNINIAYGKKGLKLSLPDDVHVDVVEPRYIEGIKNPAHAVHEALLKPIGSSPLPELIKPTDRVGIVFSDITRPMPYDIIMPEILSIFEEVHNDNIILFNATGTHRPNTETELKQILGENIVGRYTIAQNDVQVRSLHVFIGRTKMKNEIWIHKDFVNSDIRILTGFIEPHFFTGFSGGGKSIMPGLASLDTIMNNHSPVNIDSPMTRWGITYGNPIWEDIQEAGKLAEPTFLVNITLNRNKDITKIFAGDYHKAYEEGCLFAKEVAMTAVSKEYDIVITSNSGYPLDLNMYQSVKGMSAASQIVREGGSIIIAADCWDGIPDHGEYGKLLFESRSTEDLLQRIRTTGFRVQDMWQAQIHALVCEIADVYFFSEHLSDEQIESAFLIPCRDIEKTVRMLVKKYGGDVSICVLPEGPQTIPFIKK